RIYPGVIIDFVNFKELPAIVVAYFVDDYSGTDIKFATITKDSHDIEIVPCAEHELELNKERVIDRFNVSIYGAQQKVDELVKKRDYFLKHFSKHFEHGGEKVSLAGYSIGGTGYACDKHV
ncbi:MAG: hypothetical protein PHX74_12440, partial [Candidatus Sumerlaeales bacterium]|nr:hypothetical protein [Candidatus Sumerlaeales bacterium]